MRSFANPLTSPAWSAVSDAALALYPITIVWKLQVPLRTKIGLCILMGFGLLAAACAAIKTSQLYALDNTAGLSWSVSPLIVSAMTEQWITLMVACLPPSRPALKALIRKVRGGAHQIKRRTHDLVPGQFVEIKPPPKVALGGMFDCRPVGMLSNAYHEKDEPSGTGSSSADGGCGIIMKTDITIDFQDESDVDDPMKRGDSSEGSERTMVDRVTPEPWDKV